MVARRCQRCQFIASWFGLLCLAPSVGTSEFSFFSSSCADHSYGEPWTLDEIFSVAATSSLACASQCMQTSGCRGYSLDAGVCRLLSVVAATGWLTGCDSRANFPGTTFLVSATDNERSEALGKCPYYSEWQATGRDTGEGEWKEGQCVCSDNKRGVFCHLEYIQELLLVQSFNTTRAEGIQHVHVDGSDYLIEISRDDFNYTIPETGVASLEAYSPRVHRYDVNTQRYKLVQKLTSPNKPAGLATFKAAGKHYVVVDKTIYFYNPDTELFENYMAESVTVAYVSALKRRSGEVVIAFASNTHMESRTLFWWPERNEVMRRKYLPVPQCHTLKLFEVGSDLYAAAALEKNPSGDFVPSSIWRWNGTEWEMSQTLEQTNCQGFGLDVTTWHDVKYLAVTCLVAKQTFVFIWGANDRNFTLMQTLDVRKSTYRNGFFNAGGYLYLVLPNFSIGDTATMTIYRLANDVFVVHKEMLSHSSYGVSVFQQHHDVYVYIWRRLNVTDFDDSKKLAERLSWSPLFKWV